MVSRDELIADWHKRLATAVTAEAEVGSRAAWLARVRVRLYRFLLSLYGAGNWNAPDNTDRARQSLVVDDSALPFAGKPAKDAHSLRAALNSISNAREQKPEVGPLAGGISRDAWVVVASTRHGFDPQRTANALLEKGIVARVVTWPRSTLVEVPSHHQTAALDFIASQRAQLLLRPIVVRRNATATGRLARPDGVPRGLGIALGPLQGVIAVGLMLLCWPSGMELPTPQAMLGMLLVVWLTSVLMFGLAGRLIPSRRQQPPDQSS